MIWYLLLRKLLKPNIFNCYKLLVQRSLSQALSMFLLRIQITRGGSQVAFKSLHEYF